MQKIVSKYGTAAHLAFMTVAPLFLLPFFGPGRTAIALLWLSLVAFVWVFMEPSRRRGELPHEARTRVAHEMLCDPLFWFLLLVILFAGLRAVNGGVSVAFDAEQAQWSVRLPSFEFLPGCVTGAGLLPFALTVSLFVLLMGVRHALGRQARASYLLVETLFSGLAVVVFLIAHSYRHPAVAAVFRESYLTAQFTGTAFGLGLLGALVALFGAVEYGWMKSEPLAVVGLATNAVGLAVFAPPLTLAVFALSALLLAIVVFVLTHRQMGGAGSFRCFIAVVASLTAVVLYMMTDSVDSIAAAKARAFVSLSVLPDGFSAARSALDAVARRVWGLSRWFGCGLGSFPLELRFMATPAEWALIPIGQLAPTNGWWLLLAERGVVGAFIPAVVAMVLVVTWVVRLIRSFWVVSFGPLHVLGPVAALALTAVSFVDCSLWRADVTLSAVAFLALSASAFPSRRSTVGEH